MLTESWIRESNLIEGVDDPAEDARSQRAWTWLLTQGALSPEIILTLHRRIMRQHLKRDAGQWRTCPVWIAGREGIPWERIPGAIHQWLACWTTPFTPDVLEANLRAAHVEFERIHPYVDGNGRTGRMLMNWQRVKAGLKPLCIKADERASYYVWFREVKDV